MTDRVIDVYTHFMPQKQLELFETLATERGMVKRMGKLTMLYDLEARRRLVGEWQGYQQVLAPCPGAERVGELKDRPSYARLANAELAGIVRKYPDQFPAFVAALPLDDIEAALKELEHAVQLGARGVQVYTSINGKPIDAPEFEPLYAALAARDLPMWLHPARSGKVADYPAESGSEYEIWQVMGWPYETGACIARLTFSGILDRHPDLKIITHHLGGIIPYLEGRIGPLWDQLGTRTDGGKYDHILGTLKHRPLDYFRRIYGDTAVGGSAGALRCGIDFFGADRVLFASDCPFDPEGGPGFIREGLRALGEIQLTKENRKSIEVNNALRLLHLENA